MAARPQGRGLVPPSSTTPNACIERSPPFPSPIWNTMTNSRLSPTGSRAKQLRSSANTYVSPQPLPSSFFPSSFPLLQRANFSSVRPIVPLAMSKSDFISVSLLIRHSLTMTLRIPSTIPDLHFFHHPPLFSPQLSFAPPTTVLLTSLVSSVHARVCQTATGREGGQGRVRHCI